VEQIPISEWEIDSLEDAEFVINVLHRRTCRDAERMYEIEERLRKIERPWWKR
jgi:hypothetical protein